MRTPNSRSTPDSISRQLSPASSLSYSDPSVYVTNTMSGSTGLIATPEIMYGLADGRPPASLRQVSPQSSLRSTSDSAPPVSAKRSGLQRDAVNGPVRA